MSNGLSGLTQYIWAAEDERRERRWNAKREAFIKYVIGFGKHAYEISRTCPVCGKSSMKVTKAGVNKTGSQFLDGFLLMTNEVLTSSKVIASWKCNCCAYTEIKNVVFKELLDDFNDPKFRK